MLCCCLFISTDSLYSRFKRLENRSDENHAFCFSQLSFSLAKEKKGFTFLFYSTFQTIQFINHFIQINNSK